MDYGDRLKIEKELSEITDRQLQERIAYELIDTKKKTESIKNNVQFFFWLTVASIVIAVATTIK